MDIKLKKILVDFDGVISKNSLTVTLDFAHHYINMFVPVSYQTIKNYYASVNSFNLELGLKLLFSSLGIEDKLPAFIRQLSCLKEFNSNKIEIDKEFYKFIELCTKSNFEYSIFSLASKRKVLNFLKIDEDKIADLNNISKSDENVFTNQIDGIESRNVILIDDDPFALRTAKLAGLKTILMRNDLFTESLINTYKNAIDVVVSDFKELNQFLFC